jgi:class 3 adenylate cyclase
MVESRKTVTVVFADVTGSTALGERTDPETMRRIMERYFEEMRTVLERHRGTVEKFIGGCRHGGLRHSDGARGRSTAPVDVCIVERKGWALSANAVRAQLAELQSLGSPSQ